MAIFEPYLFEQGVELTAALFNAKISAPLNILAPYTLTGQTVGATLLHPISFIPAQNSAVMLTGFAMGVRSDYGAGLFSRFGCTFRRGVGAPVIAGQIIQTSEDSAGAPSVNFNVHVTHECYFYITGVAAETWKWNAIYSYKVL